MLVDNQIKQTEIRFYRIQKEMKSFYYMLRLRLYMLENIKNRFYDYALLQADKLERLQLEFLERTGLQEWNEDILQDTDLANHIAELDLDDDDEDYDEHFQ